MQPSEHLVLMVGFVAISYLATTFLTESWIHCTLGQGVSTIAIIWFYNELGYSAIKTFPAMLLVAGSCAFNAYQVEKHQKEVFLEGLNSEQLKKDLKKVFNVLPEGVMIYKRYGDRHIKLWNKELVRLFKFKQLEKLNNKAIEGQSILENDNQLPNFG